jgi:hypothetical protein
MGRRSMEDAIRLRRSDVERTGPRPFMVDTTFVLFFLAVDLGQTVGDLGIDAVFSLATVLMLLVIPYFLPFSGERPVFRNWLLGRASIAVFAVIIGAIFYRSLGGMVPEAFGYLPMTLVIITAIFSAYIQFCAILGFRSAS